jgi:hypothetical protein
MRRHLVVLFCLIGLPLILVGAYVFLFSDGPESDEIQFVSAHVGASVSDDEARAFGKNFQDTAKTCDAKRIDAMLREDELAMRVLNSLNLPPRDREFQLRVIGELREGSGKAFARLIQSGFRLSFVGIRVKQKVRHVLFRVSGQAPGAVEMRLSYFEVRLARHADGQVAGDDVYQLVQGESTAQFLRRSFLQSTTGTSLSKEERVLRENIKRVTPIMMALKAGDRREAYEIFAKLPPEVQKLKTVTLIGIGAARDVGPDAYIQAIEMFRTEYPNDPAVDLLSIDYFLLRKDYVRTLECVDRIDKAIGGDPYLAIYRSQCFVGMGRMVDSRKALEDASGQEPKTEEVTQTRVVALALSEKNHADALTWLKKAVEEFNTPSDDEILRRDSRFEEFLSTPQYREFQAWLKSRAK